MALLGGIAPPILRIQNDGELDGFIVVDMALGAAIWFGIVMFVGWIISKMRRSSAASAPLAMSRGGAPTEPPTETKPGWHPDPYGRFSYRYWDGTWTSTVSSNDRTYDDTPG